MTLDQLLESLRLGESQDVEFKAADGGLPRSLWETVSAFANTDGGTLVLGVAERDGGYAVEGVRKPEGLLKAFWDGHNNHQKLNAPVCREVDAGVVALGRHKLLCIHVPRASRQQRPVFINGNPLTGTFKRNYEGDYRCTEAEVRQMMRDAGEEPLDGRILEGFDLDDLDADTLAAYRNCFASRDPDHPFLALNEPDFLECIGALRRERRSGTEGLTLAGLVMFGRERSLLDALPHYHLDYQEQLSSDPEEQLYQGAISDPHNPNLQKMFQLLGLGEKAGSGFQKILRAWREQQWLRPLVMENLDLETTTIWLPVASMIPEDVEKELRAVVGDAYASLDELGRVILMLAHRLGEVGNEDIQPYRREHPRDIGIRLGELVGAGWLEKTGHGRGTHYRWPRSCSPDLFATLPTEPAGFEHLSPGFEHLPPASEHLNPGFEHLDADEHSRLLELAAEVRSKGKVPRSLMEATLLALCEGHWLSLQELAKLVGRDSDSLRNHYINPMLDGGLLEPRIPGKRRHPNQAYRKKGAE